MNIQTKTLAIIISSFILLALVLSLTLVNITVKSYLSIEETNVNDHLHRTLNIIQLKQDNLKQFTGDWANWDDSYQFIQHPQQTYINSNLTNETFSANSLAFISYFNRNKELVYGRKYEKKSDTQSELPEGLINLLLSNANNLLETENSISNISDIINFKGYYYLVSIHPILTSNATGSPQGLLAMGRKFDARFIKEISDMLKLDISILPADSYILSHNEKIISSLGSSNHFYINQLNNEFVHGYAYLDNANKEPALLIKLTTNRSIYKQGKETTFYLIASIIFVTLVLTILMSILIRHLIHNRLVKLSNQVNQIQNSTNLKQRVSESNDDEIGVLSKNINNMLAAIQVVNKDLNKAKRIAEEANYAKTEFLSRMNHELRTPLNAILGFSQFLEMEFEDTNNSKAKSDIDKINTSARHLLSLINRLLDLAAIEQRHYKLDITDVNVGESIRNCLSLLSPLAEKKGVTIVDMTMKYDGLVANADHDALHQVITNLVNNAIKYNKDNGSVSIQYNYTEDGLVSISISDTGYGIPGNSLEEIFEPFTRLKNSQKTEGSGIGLAITKNLIELMGGKINVDSEKNKGCRFSFTLPATKAA